MVLDRALAPAAGVPSRARRPHRTRGLGAVLVALVLVGGGLVAAVGGAGAAGATRTQGSQPVDDILSWAATYATCGLTQNQLAAMMMVPTFTETGVAATVAPSPMTLSRWDTTSTLWAFGNKATPYQGAFWNPGVGMWQFDSAGGWPLTAAGAINTATAAEQAAKVLSTRYCASTSSDVVARMKYAWSPWSYCSTSDKCLNIYNELYDGTTLSVTRLASVTRTGGMQARTCRVTGLGSLPCWYVNPALAEGDKAWAATWAGIPTPVTKPFYVFSANSREYRFWRDGDTGYAVNVLASKPVTSDARTSLTWATSASTTGTGTLLCDITVVVGACGGWSDWSTVAPGVASTPAVTNNADGRLEAFHVGTDGSVQHVWQTAANGGWGSSARLGALGAAVNVVVGRDRSGVLLAFALDRNGVLWSTSQGAEDWLPWSSVATGFSSLLSVMTNRDGRLEVFALDAGGHFVHQWQWANGSWSWWETLGGPQVVGASAGLNPDGRMEAFGVTPAGGLVHRWQIIGVGWSDWAGLPGSFASRPSVATNRDGRLELFLRGTDNGLYDLTQSPTSPIGWAGPTRLVGSAVNADPVGGRNQDGRLEVFAQNPDGTVGHAWQWSPGGTWSGWESLPGSGPAAMTPALQADGRLVVLGRRWDASLRFMTQRISVG